MAENTITVIFDPCEPTPANGYRIIYRPQGSSENFRVWPTNFLSSPAVFVDTIDQEETEYEGFIMGDCGAGMYGVRVPWQTGENSPGSGGESPGEESPPPPGPQCEIWQNTGEVNATGVSYISCDGTPIGEVDITPGSNFCAQVDTLTGPAEGSLTNMGPCELELESDNFDLANDNSTICSAPVGALLWFDGPFGPDITLFTDNTATTPQTGFSRVKLGSSNLIYNLDPVTGIVGAYTGVNC